MQFLFLHFFPYITIFNLPINLFLFFILIKINKCFSYKHIMTFKINCINHFVFFTLRYNQPHIIGLFSNYIQK